MSDDDLHGRQQVLLLAFFVTVGGGLYFVGWLTRPSFLYDNPLVCAAIAGGACFPARWLAELFPWWKGLAQPSRRTQARREGARQRELAEAREAAALRRSQTGEGRHRRMGRRRIGLVGVLIRTGRVLVGVPIALGSLAILPLGIAAGHYNQRLVADGPVLQAVVVSVEEDKWSKYDDVTVKVAHPGDGRPVEVDGGNELDPVPAVGDRIGVVDDPENPEYVVAAAVDWSTPWWVWPLGIVITLLCLGMGLAIAFG
ncbi:hypothetical protein EV649_1696 [Kribbella sp. VKM Ac-2569]|uniref:hypothetical protein n=1 Tax=Kribbella sp. VKM Ac-2569 TaxID=2512220 RepID=UPI00102C59F8|nr:hypothetical protein [Kribbella sp. VKM Ac-2569]RZT27921.1 hypothetical protein EV649_1696 [Kribbella sp. VKM Ac-2569]